MLRYWSSLLLIVASSYGATMTIVPNPVYFGANSSTSLTNITDVVGGVSVSTNLTLSDALIPASGVLPVRNGTNSVGLSVSGTYSDTGNYEAIKVWHDKTDNIGIIDVQTAGTGDDDQGLKIKLSGSGALFVDGDTAGDTRGTFAVDLQSYRDSGVRVASGSGSVCLGMANTASATGSICMGRSSIASGQHSSAIGYYASSSLYGQRAFANGDFATKGDAQQSILVARNTTSGSTSTLFLDGSSARIVVPANTTWTFEITIVARSTDGGTGNEESAAYKYVGCIERDGANNTALVGSVTETVIAEDDAGWSVAVTADDTNEALDIAVTSDDANTVRWVAKIELVEVGG